MKSIDYITDNSENNGSTIMKQVYYLKQNVEYYRKSSIIQVKRTFKNAEIISELKSVGFSDIKLVDSYLKEIKPEELDGLDRVHLLITK